jgi:hypothetical protein
MNREPPRPRLKILNSVEREAFDFPPIFNTVERKRCFDFPTALQDIATSLRTASNQLGLHAQTLENSVRQFAITFLGLIGSDPQFEGAFGRASVQKSSVSYPYSPRVRPSKITIVCGGTHQASLKGSC